jgi:NADH-ubiquinone oxidoreductase chain 6
MVEQNTVNILINVRFILRAVGFSILSWLFLYQTFYKLVIIIRALLIIKLIDSTDKVNFYWNMSFFINGGFFSGYIGVILDLLSMVAILFGIYVVISKNPIVSVLFLIGLFVSIAGYLIFTGATFIGLSYLLVYIGAVSILFLFILMLINVRISELLIENLNSIPLAILLGCFFFYFVEKALPDAETAVNKENDEVEFSFYDTLNFFSQKSEKFYVSSNG